jgi:hypothetical protein
MLNTFVHRVKRCRHLRFPWEFILLTSILSVLIIAFFSVIVTADNGRPANGIGYYTLGDKLTWIMPDDGGVVTDLKGLTPSEIEKLFPMSAEAEAAIVHAELKVPIIINGVRFEGNQISLFNGTRLYFVIGKDGTLYAFTSARGLEEYQSEQTGQPTPMYNGPESMFFKDIFYTGDKITLLTGYGYANLSLYLFDNVISSAEVSISAAWAFLYDSTNFQGNCLAIPGGMDLAELTTYGWNDRAASVRTE